MLSSLSNPLVDSVKKVKYVILNAKEASYSPAWKNSTIFACKNNDDSQWYRLPDTHYDPERGHLSFTMEHDARTGGTVQFSYFPPYSHERLLGLVGKCASSGSCRVESLGKSLDGRDIQCIVAGEGDRTAWIIHRQHPGESMA